MAYIGLSKAVPVSGSGNAGASSSRFARTYTSTGGETNFNITFNSDNVDVIVNGIKLQIYEDFIPMNNNRIILSEPTSNGDVVECIGYFQYQAGTSTVTIQDVNDAVANATYLVTHDELNVESQTITTEYTTLISNTSNTITTNFDNKLTLYNKRSEKGTHTVYFNQDVIDYDVVIEVGENAMIVGPVEISNDSIFVVNGTLTVI